MKIIISMIASLNHNDMWNIPSGERIIESLLVKYNIYYPKQKKSCKK